MSQQKYGAVFCADLGQKTNPKRASTVRAVFVTMTRWLTSIILLFGLVQSLLSTYLYHI